MGKTSDYFGSHGRRYSGTLPEYSKSTPSALHKMMALLLAVFFFISVVLDQSQKLTIMAGHILKNAKRVFGIPDFKYYALGDGLYTIFSQFPGSLQNHQKLKQTQLAFGFT